MQQFTVVAAIQETSASSLSTLAREYVQAYRENGNFYGASAIEFQVADALI
jgi:hypothetical protein